MESSHGHDIFKGIVKLYFRKMANCVVCENVRSRKWEPKAKKFREIRSRELRGGLTLSRIYPGGFCH
ncbi:hypothetical protein QUA27_05315 [Microcoleus sp. Pol14C6]|uniref:hypothetical protein n=1 Tax=unclassified Microcoleus TaxID=2642155 RepID=UPI002FD49744